MQDRITQTETLRQEALQSGSATAVAAWERYIRQTARMEATAAQLRAALGTAYGIAHGLRLRHQGEEIYLEHLVVGATGVFLIECMEDDDPQWRADLGRNIAFLLQALGADGAFFVPLVISRSGLLVELPVGTRPVDSLEAALAVITTGRLNGELPPATARELWNILTAVKARGPVRSTAEPFLARFGLLGGLLVGLPVGMNIILTAVDGQGFISWFAGVVLLVLPTWLILGLTRLLRRPRARRVADWILLAISLLWFLLLIVGMLSD